MTAEVYEEVNSGNAWVCLTTEDRGIREATWIRLSEAREISDALHRYDLAKAHDAAV